MNTPVSDVVTEHVDLAELERIVTVQRAAHHRDGDPSAEIRRDRINRLMLAILEVADDLATALAQDYGARPTGLSKLFDVLAWVNDAKDTRERLEEWMRPVHLDGPVPAFIQQKPKGVVGVMGAWNFPVTLTVQPALPALAAGNRVILKFPETHPRTGKIFADAVGRHFDESELAVVVGDLATAQAFSALPLDHLLVTGSPAAGRAIAAAAGRNLVPLTLELGGKNPVVLGRDADIAVAAHRIALGRMMNGGQICLCPDYVFVPRERLEVFLTALQGAFREIFPTYLDNAGAVSMVNDRNYDRVIGLIDDAVAKGATKISVTAEHENDLLPARESRLIPPTILLDVPDEAAVSREEIFGPVIAVYSYSDVREAVSHITSRPSPLGAYWFGAENGDYSYLLAYTNSGGVTRNDVFAHQVVPGAPFGGVGGSGYGAYHGKFGFDEFTHRRTVATVDGDRSFADGAVGAGVADAEVEAGFDQAIAAELAAVRKLLE
ncbi:aldehyde dehydrogenase family protein [Nocardia alni]|uniref:aldehyde dehydrogenase family protein n=1 Tax=Nocardia alni TaxID=2815723 RepID=UPI001C214BFC|nr:aldehyde dehydrogenase family protein [Nocardia alni]